MARRGNSPIPAKAHFWFRRQVGEFGGKFLDYWNAHGGVIQLGYPISDEFLEQSGLDGKQYLVQYFERAVLELHPENQAPYDVLLSQLGTLRFKQRYEVVGLNAGN